MTERRTIDVSGMCCAGCENSLESGLQGVAGVRRVEADHEAETVEVVVEGDVEDDAVEGAVRRAGYEVVA